MPFEALDETRFLPIFNEILHMLLHKHAAFRASVKEILELPELASRVEKFRPPPENPEGNL